MSVGKNHYGLGVGDGFRLHASSQAIAAQLKATRAQRDRYARWVDRLEQLHAQRVAETASGEWPYADCPCDTHTVRAAGTQDGGAQ